MKTNSDRAPLIKKAVDELFEQQQTSRSGSLGAFSTPRVAVYDRNLSEPDVIDVDGDEPREIMSRLTSQVQTVVDRLGGTVPPIAIREVIENLVHADFSEVVVSVLKNGNLIKVADQGPGISEKKRALEPGFSTASTTVKDLIRGIGAGLATASRALSDKGGTLKIEDNLAGGSVITMAIPERAAHKASADDHKLSACRHLTKRQKKALFVIVELGSAGPSRIATELSSGLSTAYRDLQILEEIGLIQRDKAGKRSLTDFGVNSLDSIMGGS